VIGPRSELLERYGTGELTKEGSFPLAAKLALAILGIKAIEWDRESALAEQAAEAESARAQEAATMAPIHDSLKYGSAEELAKSAGRMMAKQAIGAPVFGALASAAKKTLTNPKVLGTAAVAGGTYGAYKGMSALRDYRSGPQAPQRWGTGNRLRVGVSEYGY